MSDEEIVKSRKQEDQVGSIIECSTVTSSTLDQEITDRWHVFIGDCDFVNNYLEDKSMSSVWILLQFCNSLTRSFGQVIFANNPISGLFIMLGVGVADFRALLTAVATTSLSFLVALLLRQDKDAVYNGVFGCNPVLIGTVSVSVLPVMYSQVSITEPRFWLFISLATVLSIYITSATMNFCRHIGQYPAPSFTLPFNVVQYILIFCLLRNSVPAQILSSDLLEAPGLTEFPDFNETTEKIEPSEEFVNVTSEGTLNWGRVFSGTLVSMSQVYGLNNVPCSLLMFLGLVIYSPTTAAFSYLGGLLGTLLGQLFAVSNEDIYSGVWGYNALLIAGSLAGFSFVLTVHSAVLAFFGVLCSLALQHIYTPLATLLGIPVLTIPFNFTSLIFNLVTSEGNSLVRPIVYSSPEKHRQQMLGSIRERKARHIPDKWSDFGEV